MVSGPREGRIIKVGGGGLQDFPNPGWTFICRLETLRSLRSRMFLARCARAPFWILMQDTLNLNGLLTAIISSIITIHYPHHFHFHQCRIGSVLLTVIYRYFHFIFRRHHQIKFSMKHQYHQHQHHNDPSPDMMFYKHLQAASTWLVNASQRAL